MFSWMCSYAKKRRDIYRLYTVYNIMVAFIYFQKKNPHCAKERAAHAGGGGGDGRKKYCQELGEPVAR